MNKVITINLNGNAYQLEENGYEALRSYLDNASRKLGSNPDREEIIADIEQSIADKFRASLGVNKTVVVTKEVEQVIEQMGPVQDPTGASEDEPASKRPDAAAGTPKAGPGPSAPGSTKRLYRIREGAMVAGVCNGLAAFVGIDVTLVRILFAVSAVSFGAGFLLYLVLMFIIPHANTPEEMAAAYGVPSTAEEFIRRAKEGYYGGMKSFGDKKAFREWKWKFKQDMRQFRRQMRENARSWHWRWQWPASPPVDPASMILGPILGLVLTVLTLLCLLSIASLILTGAVCGILLPAGVPLWMGIILLIVFFGLIKWPFKVIRHGLCYSGYPRYFSPFSYFWHSFGWLLLAVLLLWLADQHSATAHQILGHLRSAAHHGVDALRVWWAHQ